MLERLSNHRFSLMILQLFLFDSAVIVTPSTSRKHFPTLSWMKKTAMLHDSSGYQIQKTLKANFVTYRFKAVSFGTSCSPFILNATIKKYFESIDTIIAEKMKTNIYVDNLASGSDNEEDASTFLEQARLITSPVGFNQRSWNSNDTRI